MKSRFFVVVETVDFFIQNMPTEGKMGGGRRVSCEERIAGLLESLSHLCIIRIFLAYFIIFTSFSDDSGGSNPIGDSSESIMQV